MAGPFDGLKYVPDAAPAAAPADVDDPELSFLKPRVPGASPYAGLKYQADEEPAGPQDRIGRAAADFDANLKALQSGQPGGPVPTAPDTGGDKIAPYGLAGVVTSQPGAPAAPTISRGEAFGRGALQGATLGWGDEIAAAADTLISHVPGVRAAAEALAPTAGGRGASLDYTNPNLTYEERRDAYRRFNEAAKAQHGKLYTTGEIAGGVAATPLLPGIGEVKGLSTAAKLGRVGIAGAEVGGIAGAGGSEATNAKDYLKDTGVGVGVGGVGGVVLHAGAEKAADLLAKKLPALADRQAVQALGKGELKAGAPESLTRPMVQDPNISAAINEPIQVGKKTTTLAKVAGRPAEEVQPILKTAQAKVEKGLADLGKKADAAEPATLAGLANHYDSKIAALAKQPGNEKAIRALEMAKDDALQSWSPTEEAIEARKGQIGKQTEKIYAGADKASGGVKLGDLVDHYNAQIAEAKKTPGNEALVSGLEAARDSATKAWGTRPVFNPDVVAADGPFAGNTTGEAVAKLEKMAKGQRPEAAKQLQAEADRIRAAATREGIDPTVQVPAKDVRAYATHLQNEGAIPPGTDPNAARRAKQFLGATTKDFINGQVEKHLGPADRKALEALNQRTSDLYSYPDVLSGKNSDTAVRNRVLNEFDTRIPHSDLDAYASKLEERGTQRIDKLQPGEQAQAKENMGKATREFVEKHAANNLSPEDAAERARLLAHRQSLRNIDKVLVDRASKEAQNKAGMAGSNLRTMGHGLGAYELINAIPKAIHGDYGGAAVDIGKAAALSGLPTMLTKANAVKRGLVRAGTGGTEMIARLAANAAKGNPWAVRMMDLLRSTPSGAARLAAALAHVNGGAAPSPPPETP